MKTPKQVLFSILLVSVLFGELRAYYLNQGPFESSLVQVKKRTPVFFPLLFMSHDDVNDMRIDDEDIAPKLVEKSQNQAKLNGSGSKDCFRFWLSPKRNIKCNLKLFK